MLNKCSSLLYHLRVEIGFEDHPDHLWIPKEDSSPNLACIYSFCLNSFSYSHWLLPDLLDFDKAISFIKLMVSMRWAICFLFHPYSDLGFAFWIHINLVLHTKCVASVVALFGHFKAGAITILGAFPTSSQGSSLRNGVMTKIPLNTGCWS